MNTIKAGIIGAAGYTGGELIRLLIHHPNVELAFASSRSHAGKPVYEVHSDLLGDTSLRFDERGNMEDIDVVFLCAGHGAAKEALDNSALPQSLKIIDLSQDFRLAKNARYQNRIFTYGLPELNREAIKNANNIANPGCFASAIELALLPLAKAGILKEVYTTGVTGSTGAGQALSATTHFSWRANNISAYKTLQHQHIYEIAESMLQAGNEAVLPEDNNRGPDIWFVPWRGDFTRGIFTSSTLNCDLPETTLKALYQDFYQEARFTHVSDTPIHLKQVVNTNKCLIHLEHHSGKLVVHSALDNLLKGASGQALQNMNLMFGFDEDAGLKIKSPGF